jgi:hypothetical protein
MKLGGVCSQLSLPKLNLIEMLQIPYHLTLSKSNYFIYERISITPDFFVRCRISVFRATFIQTNRKFLYLNFTLILFF